MKLWIPIMVIVIVFLTGCVGTPQQHVVQDLPEHPFQHDFDKLTELSDIIIGKAPRIADSGERLSSAIASNNREDILFYGKNLRDDSEKCLNELDSLNVSSELKHIFDEHRKGVQICYDVGKLAESGAITQMTDKERRLVVVNLTDGVSAMTRSVVALRRYTEDMTSAVQALRKNNT